MIHVCVIKGHIRGDFFCPSASCFVHPQARPSHTAQVTPPNYLIYLSTITESSSCNHFFVAATSSNNHICLYRALPNTSTLLDLPSQITKNLTSHQVFTNSQTSCQRYAIHELPTLVHSHLTSPSGRYQTGTSSSSELASSSAYQIYPPPHPTSTPQPPPPPPPSKTSSS